jgi:hypothetical protein
MVAIEGDLALNTGTVLRPSTYDLVEFKISFDAVENGNDGTASTKHETVGISDTALYSKSRIVNGPAVCGVIAQSV